MVNWKKVGLIVGAPTLLVVALGLGIKSCASTQRPEVFTPYEIQLNNNTVSATSKDGEDVITVEMADGTVFSYTGRAGKVYAVCKESGFNKANISLENQKVNDAMTKQYTGLMQAINKEVAQEQEDLYSKLFPKQSNE